MEIYLNQTTTEIPEHISVEQLLASIFKDRAKGIAVAVNQTIIPKSKWAEHIILSQDQVTLIRATQGG